MVKYSPLLEPLSTHKWLVCTVCEEDGSEGEVDIYLATLERKRKGDQIIAELRAILSHIATLENPWSFRQLKLWDKGIYQLRFRDTHRFHLIPVPGDCGRLLVVFHNYNKPGQRETPSRVAAKIKTEALRIQEASPLTQKPTPPTT